LLVVIRNNNVDGSILLLGDWLRLDARGHLSIDKLLNELIDILVSNLLALVKGKFLILDRLLDSESWEFANLEIEVGGMGTEGFGINNSEVDLALVLDSNGSDLFCKGRALFRGLCEDIRQGNASLFARICK
jgi:hypothetical protein